MDLQATVEFSIELYKFYNIDLFQRGFYQLKCHLKVAPKVLPIQIETGIGDETYPGQSYGTSQVFQILYRNEEVMLRDLVMFRAHLLVDSRHLKESIERAEFSLTVELWFGDQAVESCLNLVSSRTLQLNFHPVLGLHYHLPILFDYFHLSAVSLQINASLIVISTKYVNLQKNSKIWSNTTKLNCRTPSSQLDFTSGQLDALFFGTQVGNVVRCAGGNSWRLAHARTVHKEICELLLGALESLSITLEEYNAVTPINYKTNRRKLSIQQRLKFMVDSAEIMENENDFTSHANSNIAKLCAECVSLWRKVVAATAKTSIKNLLSKKNHTLRVRRFAEGFFMIRHSRQELNDPNLRNDIEMCQLARTKYLTSIPMLPVHCNSLDGDAHTLPLIFEDQYEGATITSKQSTPHMNGHLNGHMDIRQRSHSMISPANSMKHCSCKHLPGLINNCKMIGVMTPRYALGSEILQASLTIIPAAAHADLRGSSFRHHDYNMSGGVIGGSGCYSQPALPNRHSKSLDQLEQHSTPNIRTIEEAELMYTSASGANFIEHSSQENVMISVNNPKKVNSADLLRNINEFKMKYKNPGTFGGSMLLNNAAAAATHDITCYVPPSDILKSESERSAGGRGVENKPQQKLPNGDLHWNSLPKTTSSGRQKKYTKHGKSGTGSFSTLPKSKSSQNINKLNSSQHSFRYSRVRITDYKRSMGRNRKRGGSRGSVNRSQSEINSSSTDSEDNQVYEKCKMPRTKKKILASVSVPFQLENYDRKDDFSESLPNLAPPPAGFRNQDTRTNAKTKPTKLSSASLTSPMSEESGDVTSGPTSPRFVKSESLRINGEKMRKKLQQLALTTSASVSSATKPKRPNRRGKTKSEKSKSEFDLPSMNDGVAIADIKLVPPEEFRDSVFTPLPPAEFRDVQEMQEEEDVKQPPVPTKKIEKTVFTFDKPAPQPVRLRSNGSLYSVRSGDYDNFQRMQNGATTNGHTPNGGDAVFHTHSTNNSIKKRGSHLSLNALDQHRGSVGHMNHVLTSVTTTTTTKTTIVKHLGSCQAFDNPIYHMCELSQPMFTPADIPQCNGGAPRRGSTKIIKSQSTNQLFDAAGRTSSSSHGSGNCCSRTSSPREIHKTIEVKPKNDNGNDEDEKTERLQEPPLLEFEKCREEFRKQVNYTGAIYSDFTKLASELPYFYINDELRAFSPNGLHLIVCVHGLDGNSNDLRLFRTYLELGLPGVNLDFLMSERNQGDTFSDFDTMTDRLVDEILYHIESYGLNPTKISFVAHSLGTILVRAALSKPQMKPYLSKLHTFLSLSGPHLGTLYNNSGLVNMGMWFMQKWKKSGSLLQLSLRDAADLRQSYLYKLSQRSQLHHFKNILLVGSLQDRYVPLHSARLEICKQAQRDNSLIGMVYKEMVHNILSPIMAKPDIHLSRFDVHHALPKMMHNASVFIGRAAHIAVLDSELFIEKFLLVAGLKYFT